MLRYLSIDVNETSRINEETSHRVTEGERIGGALRAVRRGKKLLEGRWGIRTVKKKSNLSAEMKKIL